jgi:hypothetical protein
MISSSVESLQNPANADFMKLKNSLYKVLLQREMTDFDANYSQDINTTTETE